jgi:hypothetical protein
MALFFLQDYSVISIFPYPYPRLVLYWEPPPPVLETIPRADMFGVYVSGFHG